MRLSIWVQRKKRSTERSCSEEEQREGEIKVYVCAASSCCEHQHQWDREFSIDIEKISQVGQKGERSLVLEAFNDVWKIYLRCLVWWERFFET